MKQLLLLISLFFFFSINAQVKLRPGIKTGLNLANITNANAENRPDFYVGAFLTLKFSDSYTLQPEWIYSRQGAVVQKRRETLAGEVINPEIELDYLSLAIANKFTLFNDNNLQAIIGLYTGFRIKDNIKASFLVDILGFDMGGFIGVEYKLLPNLSVEARFKRGFLDMSKLHVDNSPLGGEKYKDRTLSNKVIQIGVNYKFDF